MSNVNPATGEVVAELGGKTFRLRATMQRVGELETRLGVDGLPGVTAKLQQKSAGATLIALQCLCVSGNEDELDELHYGEIASAIAAIWQALAAGLPESAKGKAGAARKNGRHLGRDIEQSPLAS